jgi:hypothetical protein
VSRYTPRDPTGRLDFAPPTTVPYPLSHTRRLTPRCILELGRDRSQQPQGLCLPKAPEKPLTSASHSSFPRDTLAWFHHVRLGSICARCSSICVRCSSICARCSSSCIRCSSICFRCSSICVRCSSICLEHDRNPHSEGCPRHEQLEPNSLAATSRPALRSLPSKSVQSGPFRPARTTRYPLSTTKPMPWSTLKLEVGEGEGAYTPHPATKPSKLNGCNLCQSIRVREMFLQI